MDLFQAAAIVWLTLISGFIYFLPSLVAHGRGHHQMVPIVLLNLFLGWSLIGWVAALVWATVALPAQVVVSETK